MKGRIGRRTATIAGMALSLGLLSAGYAAIQINKMKVTPGPTRSGGAAAILGQDRTGSPLSGGSTCSGCHAGGNYSPSITIQVKDDQNNVVTSYTAGNTYTIEYSVNAALGTPSAYAMQAVAISPASGNPGAGTYGTINSPNSQISTVAGREYFEQQGAQAAGFFSVDWVAPSAGFGQVDIYAVGVAINVNGGTSGDQTTPSTTLSITEDVPTTIDFPGNPYCANAPDPTAVVTGQQGGVFISSPSGLDIGTVSGQINMAASTPGTYTVTYTAGGQSTTFNVTINDTYTVSDAATICANETLQFGTQTLTSANAGLNTEVFQSINGCDSTVNLTLTVINNPVTQLAETICSNETVQFNGQTLDASNAGLNTFTTSGSNGCDSTVNLTLTVLPSVTTQISETICSGETFDFNGQMLDASNAGLNTATLSNVNGCDSVVELTLNVTTIDLGILPTPYQLTVSQQPNATYQWLDCEENFAIVPNETSDELLVNDIGTWAAEITINGCVDTTDCESPIYMGLDEKLTSVLNVYPSPATTLLKVDNLNELIDPKEMTIITISGQTIWSSAMAMDEISVEKLPAGTYLLKVQHAKGEEVVRFVKR